MEGKEGIIKACTKSREDGESILNNEIKASILPTPQVKSRGEATSFFSSLGEGIIFACLGNKY